MEGPPTAPITPKKEELLSSAEAGLKRRGLEPLKKKEESKIEKEEKVLPSRLEVAMRRADALRSKAGKKEESGAEDGDKSELAPAPSPEERSPEKESKFRFELDRARREFMEAEADPNVSDSEHEAAKEKYEKARAEYVADDILDRKSVV